jgi:dihydrodipicolinate synthase/N-acetylneuraminate lyase
MLSYYRRELPMTTLTAQDLDTAIAFLILPFRQGRLDLNAHRKNAAYLAGHCFLDGGRKRVIAIGGSSLLHHVTPEEQFDVVRILGEEAGDRAWFISAVLPTPPRQAETLVRRQMELPRPPDAVLLLPLIGGYNPEGALRDLRRFCEDLGREVGARFIVYLRDAALRDACCRLVRESEYVLGIKIGTSEEDVQPAREAVGSTGAVVWGKGDLCTRAARLGARGHTSGTSLLSLRASDAINNAHRRGDFEAAERIEEELRGLEEIRFMHGRIYNYSALVEALNIAAFPDVDPGDGGPFNEVPPPEIREQLRGVVERLRPYHFPPGSGSESGQR